MEYEISEIPPLSSSELSLVEMHSLLNILSVLGIELELIGLRLAKNSRLLATSIDSFKHIVTCLSDPARALEFATHVGAQEQRVLAEIEAARVRHETPETMAKFRDSLENITSVFRILEVRANEVLARTRQPDAWVEFALEELRRDFREVFAAIEKNSHGRYRIIYNLARQQPADYYVDFVIESFDGRTASLPVIFKDVMRDLVANARKYTKPGGSIQLGLYETNDELRFVVQDTGCGIPPDEIQTVAHFGRRGSNVQAVRTMGGGFGLTKAFLVAKRFGGRMWIRSELNQGTRITITLPRPVAK